MSRLETEGFAEPWQARAFAMTQCLIDAGLFTASEWADALSVELHDPGACQDGSDYYDRWLAALRRLLEDRDVASDRLVDSLTEAWHAAARATPHGTPIDLPAQALAILHD